MVTREDRWAAHPVWAAVVRAAIVLVPLALSVAAAVVAGRILPEGESLPERVGWWLLVLAVSSVVLLLTDRVARRLLPLAVLLELSLVFPDRAPSRMRTVRTASVRDIERQLDRLREPGSASQPSDAADTLVALVGMLGVHDKRTRGHSERVRAFVDLLTDEMGMPEDERVRVRWAALVHDLGKLTVPSTVLNKPAALDDEEWQVIRRHPREGTRLVAGLLPWLGEWGRAIGEHHERWDGGGYPDGLAAEQISLGARIVAVADAYEVMTSNRSYSRARAAAVAREELTACAGSHFDPQVVRSFLCISLGRLRWVAGPLSWAASVPLLVLDRGGQAARLAAAALGVATVAVAGGGAPSPSSDRAQLTGPSDTGVGSSAAPAPGSVVVAAPLPRLTSPASPPAIGAPATSTAAPSAAARPAPTALASRPASPASRPPTGRTPSTYWFTASSGGYALSPSAPTHAGAPADVDSDGRPGLTLRPAKAGLDTTAPGERVLLTLAVTRPLRLSGVPTVELWSRLSTAKGNAKVLLRLDRCTSGGVCSPLSQGQREDGTWSAGSAFGVHSIDLDAVDVVVAAGQRLRLVIVANARGTSSDLLVAVGSRSAPSRIVLPVR